MKIILAILLFSSLISFGQNNQETLNPNVYDNLLGDYQTEKGDIIVIGRSQTRLYAYFENTQKYRGLRKIDSLNWTAGNVVVSDSIIQKFVFKPTHLEIYEKDKLIVKATKKAFYSTEKVIYSNKNGVKLGATLFKPTKSSHKAIVLVHGSGGQDRNGYASIIRLLADIMARQGVTVLTYDKQGVGSSEGDFNKQNFTQLAQDAISGIQYLKNRKDLKLTKIGLGGSSQAGWIIAKAIEQSNQIDFSLLIGAAGSGVSVTEQNLYNTKVQMACTGQFTTQKIEQALQQQRYFFDYISTQKNGKLLDDLTQKLAQDSILNNWLFPTTNNIDLTNRNQWFTALEINFDPLSIWRKYKRPTLMLFSQYDDSTPTEVVISKVKQLKNDKIKTIVLQNAQHIGLETTSICKAEVPDLDVFNKQFFNSIILWLNTL
jgi:pimeloyl-ACP methyl ester carboxylesterase